MSVGPFAWRPKRSRTLLSFFWESTEAGENFGKFFLSLYTLPMILRCFAAVGLSLFFVACPTKTAPVTQMDQQAIRDRANATHEDLKREEKKSEERKEQQQ